jgi:hypothetical protein
MHGENYNPVIHKVLGGHRKHKTESYRHFGNTSYPVTMLADSNRVFKHMGGVPIGGHGAPNMVLVDLIPDYAN